LAPRCAIAADVHAANIRAEADNVNAAILVVLMMRSVFSAVCGMSSVRLLLTDVGMAQIRATAVLLHQPRALRGSDAVETFNTVHP
jgi:hypothetical protein